MFLSVKPNTPQFVGSTGVSKSDQYHRWYNFSISLGFKWACETVSELSLNTDSCIFARYQYTCNSVSVLLSSVVWLLLALTLVLLVCNISLATLLKPIWEALALVHSWWIFKSLKERNFTELVCLLYMYKINFTMLQLVVASFMCPHGPSILPFCEICIPCAGQRCQFF